MTTVASTLLTFLLDLLRDEELAAAYAENPQKVLDEAGLDDITPEDVVALAPMVTDYASYGDWEGLGDAGHGHSDSSDEDGYAAKTVKQDEDDEHCHDDHAKHDHAKHDHGHKNDYGHKPVKDEDEDEDEDKGEDEKEYDHDHDGHSGGHHHAPSHAGGTETVVITHLQEVHYTKNETNIEIDASHSIWVSGDAQAIFGDVAGDVTQIDNDGGVVAGDDIEGDVHIDNSDNSITDSFNTEIRDSNVNVGGNQAVDSFNQDNDGVDVEKIEDSFNGNDIGSHNEDNDVIADRGGQVGDNTSVSIVDSGNTDNSVNDSFNGNDFSQDNDGIDDSFNGNDLSKENVGNDYSDNSYTDNSVNDSFNDSSDNSVSDSFNDNSDRSVNDSFNTDNSFTDESVNDSFNDNSFTDNSVNDSLNDNSVTDKSVDESFNDNSVNESFNDNSDNSTTSDDDFIDVDDTAVAVDDSEATVGA